jgi:hypothetical protein
MLNLEASLDLLKRALLEDVGFDQNHRLPVAMEAAHALGRLGSDAALTALLNGAPHARCHHVFCIAEQGLQAALVEQSSASLPKNAPRPHVRFLLQLLEDAEGMPRDALSWMS